MDNIDLEYKIIENQSEIFLYLDTLIIRGKENRSKGLGSKILKQVISIAKNSKCKYILLKADTKQPQNKGFILVDWYKKYGFQEIEKQGYMVIMKKIL